MHVIPSVLSLDRDILAALSRAGRGPKGRRKHLELGPPTRPHRRPRRTDIFPSVDTPSPTLRPQARRSHGSAPLNPRADLLPPNFHTRSRCPLINTLPHAPRFTPHASASSATFFASGSPVSPSSSSRGRFFCEASEAGEPGSPSGRALAGETSFLESDGGSAVRASDSGTGEPATAVVDLPG